jgi:hypothetical protein
LSSSGYFIKKSRQWLLTGFFNTLSKRLVAGAAFVNRDQVLGGGCNCGIADMLKYHNFWEGFKSTDMLEKSQL